MTYNASAPSGTVPTIFYKLSSNGNCLSTFTLRPNSRDPYDWRDYNKKDEATTQEKALEVLLNLQKTDKQLVIYHDNNDGMPRLIFHKTARIYQYKAPFLASTSIRLMHKCKINDAISYIHELKMPLNKYFDNINKKLNNIIQTILIGVEIPLLGAIPAVIISTIGVIYTITNIAISILFSMPAIFSKNARIIATRSFVNATIMGPFLIIGGGIRAFYSILLSPIFCLFNLFKSK